MFSRSCFLGTKARRKLGSGRWFVVAARSLSPPEPLPFAAQASSAPKRASVAPKKTDEAAKAGGTIGDLIKQKLGEKLTKKEEDGEEGEDAES